jgi:hypothetical protein
MQNFHGILGIFATFLPLSKFGSEAFLAVHNSEMEFSRPLKIGLLYPTQ